LSTLLLDTHALLWAFNEPDKLAPAARDGVADRDNRVLVSAIGIYELSLKHRLGKLDEAELLLSDLHAHLERYAFEVLPVGHRHALTAGALPFLHRDPFDRLLVGQALVEDVVLVSNEALFDHYGVRRLW